jgi:hypothetical protein
MGMCETEKRERERECEIKLDTEVHRRIQKRVQRKATVSTEWSSQTWESRFCQTTTHNTET